MTQGGGGTHTFLFTDIEGSTRLIQAKADIYPRLLSEHRQLIGEAVRAADGRIFGTEGDALFCVFESPVAAVAAAAAAQRALTGHEWPPEGEIRVRMGIHSGDRCNGRFEDAEQGVTLGAEDAAVRRSDCLADELAMFAEQARVYVGLGLNQARRALDVGKQEGVRSAAALGHGDSSSSSMPGQARPCVLSGDTAVATAGMASSRNVPSISWARSRAPPRLSSR